MLNASAGNNDVAFQDGVKSLSLARAFVYLPRLRTFLGGVGVVVFHALTYLYCMKFL